jgi:hypothetical protein
MLHLRRILCAHAEFNLIRLGWAHSDSLKMEVARIIVETSISAICAIFIHASACVRFSR